MANPRLSTNGAAEGVLNLRIVNTDRMTALAARARRRALASELRRMYDATVHEPVPEEFIELLRQIDDKGP